MYQRPRGEIWISNQKVVTDEKSWKTWKSNQNSVMNEELGQNSVMNEELVQNGVTNEKFVKNSVMNAEIDPKVVSLQPIHQNLLEEFSDVNEPWLLIGIPSRDPFFVTQYLARHSVSSDQHTKKLMSLPEGLHVVMQCDLRQHFADRHWLHEHPGGHASWREPTMRKFTKESTTHFVNGPLCR